MEAEMDNENLSARLERQMELYDKAAGQFLATQIAVTMLMGMESIRDSRFPDITKASFDGIIGRMPVPNDPAIMIAAREHFAIMVEDAKKVEQAFNSPSASEKGFRALLGRLARRFGGTQQ